MACIASDVTPLIITHNEEANIGRTLERLVWAERIVIVDSGSTDRTLSIAKSFPQVEVFYRPFDSFARQCNYGLTLIRSKFVLSLDADYVLSPDLVREILDLRMGDAIDGYQARFIYMINGRSLRASLYPPRVVLYCPEKAHYVDEGHGHRVRVRGPVDRLRHPVFHDDRKLLARWMSSQMRNAEREARMLLETGAGGSAADRIRRTGWLMPVIVPFYVLFLKGCIANGRAGWTYALQRTLAEIAIALHLLDARLATSLAGSPLGSRRSALPSTTGEAQENH